MSRKRAERSQMNADYKAARHQLEVEMRAKYCVQQRLIEVERELADTILQLHKWQDRAEALRWALLGEGKHHDTQP